MPKEAFDSLRQRIGAPFDGLEQGERIVLATALIEGDVTDTRMQDLLVDHPSDITKMLRGLVERGFLQTDNQRRWTRYRLPAAIAPSHDLFSTAVQNEGAPGGDSPPLPRDSSLLHPNSSPLGGQ